MRADAGLFQRASPSHPGAHGWRPQKNLFFGADNYEWHWGYKATFGLSHMDPATKDRVLKPSADWFSRTIRLHPDVQTVATFQSQADFQPLLKR